MTTPVYLVRRAEAAPELAGAWDGPAWGTAVVMQVAHFHPRSSAHRPATRCKLLYGEAAACGGAPTTWLHGLFAVDDRYVRSVHTSYDSDTYKDSCVELFLQPPGRTAYFALELNCGGAFSLRFIEDPTRTADRFAKWTAVDARLAATIRVAHALPAVVEPEHGGPCPWWVEFAWPLEAMVPYCGPIGRVAGTRWRANAFKCADETSHPHWASWAPIGDALNFHQPGHFGCLEFARA
jgi:hypothetical protein